MNAEGTGKFFSSKAEAVAEVRQLRAGGMRLIDVGCMQINLHHHPNAFPSIDEAFDPLANARYAARFLTELKAASGDWMVAAGNYHSHTPHRSEAYRAQVALRWPEEQRLACGLVERAPPRGCRCRHSWAQHPRRATARCHPHVRCGAGGRARTGPRLLSQHGYPARHPRRAASRARFGRRARVITRGSCRRE
jgi:hypothetical protein